MPDPTEAAAAFADLIRSLGKTEDTESPFAGIGPSPEFGQVPDHPVIPKADADAIAAKIDAAVARGDVQIVGKILRIAAGFAPGLKALLGV